MMVPNKTEKGTTLTTMITGFMVLYFIFKTEVLLFVGIGIGVLGLGIPKVGDAIIWLWFKLAQGLGWVNARILLGVVFYLFLFPIAMVYKLTKKDPLALKAKNKSSLFVTRDHNYTKEDFVNTW